MEDNKNIGELADMIKFFDTFLKPCGRLLVFYVGHICV